jgi:hypothetical protein
MGIEVATVRLPYEPVFGDGLYKVVVPRNTFNFYNHGETVVGDAIEAEYVLNTGVKPYDLALTPAEGDVPFIDDITFTFNDWWMSSACVQWDENWNMRKENAAVAVDEEGNVLSTATLTTEYGENWAMYHKIDFEPAIRQEGACKVIEGWNVFDTDYDGMGDSEGFVLDYNIVPGAPELVVTPADGETAASGFLATEIARAQAAEKANADAIALINDSANGILAQAKKHTDDTVAALPFATAEKGGLVKSSTDVNKIKVETDGTMTVNKISTSNLIVPENEELVLNGGSAN